MNARILIRGGCVLTLGARTPNHPDADVLVEDGVITDIGTGLRGRDATVVDATNCIVMPGFIDTHRHLWKSLFRNLGETGSVDGVPLSAKVYGPHYSPEDVYAATLIGLLGAAEAGITTVVDWSDIHVDAAHVDAALEAHVDAGLRTVFVHAMPEWGGSQEDEKAGLRRLAARQVDLPISIAFGPRNPGRLDLDRVSRDWALARGLGMRIHTHVGSDPDERGVIFDIAQRGLLGEDVTPSSIVRISTTPTSMPLPHTRPRSPSLRPVRWQTGWVFLPSRG